MERGSEGFQSGENFDGNKLSILNEGHIKMAEEIMGGILWPRSPENQRFPPASMDFYMVPPPHPSPLPTPARIPVVGGIGEFQPTFLKRFPSSHAMGCCLCSG